MSNVSKNSKLDAKNQWKLLKELSECQKEIDKLNLQTSDDILNVEEKYEKLRQPLYKKRNEAIKRLPNFWEISFMNHPAVIEYMGKQGLSLIRNLEVENLEKIKSGYRIHFHFKENPYFQNKILTKEFRFGNSPNGKWVNSTSTAIQWKEGKNLLLAKQDTSSTLYKTFFDWFLAKPNPNFDYIGDFIRDDLWINPLRYYCMHNEEEQNLDEECKEDDDVDEGQEEDDVDEGKEEDDVDEGKEEENIGI